MRDNLPPLPDWREHVEQRLRQWRQSFVNKSGDRLALDDFMDAASMEDLVDFVCDEWAAPPAPQTQRPVRLTDEQSVKCLVEADCVDTVKMTYESGPYEITVPTMRARLLISAVEAEVLRLFLHQIGSIYDRVAACEAEERRMLAHGLVGSARGIGAFSLAECAAEMEARPGSEILRKRLRVKIDEVRDFIAAISR